MLNILLRNKVDNNLLSKLLELRSFTRLLCLNIGVSVCSTIQHAQHYPFEHLGLSLLNYKESINATTSVFSEPLMVVIMSHAYTFEITAIAILQMFVSASFTVYAK